MRKIIFILAMLPATILAQTNFGYFNYSEVLHKLPQYKNVKSDYEELVKRCDKEIERNEMELTRSYVAFLDEQHNFPEPILRKRQKELQELVDKSIIFRDQLKVWLIQAHDSLFAPLHATIDDAVARVCVYNELAYIIDLEKAGYVFVNPRNGFDVTNAVLGTIANMGEPQKIKATDGVRKEDVLREEGGTETENSNSEAKEESGDIYNEEITEGAFH